MRRDAQVTRDRLLRAAEHLFARRGVDGVRVWEINQLAGQRNSSALHYHFGSRAGLLEAILTQHRSRIEERRVVLLDRLEAAQRTDDLRAVVETIVVPFTAELATESGRDHLRILPQVIGRDGVPVGPIPDDVGPSGLRRSLRYLDQCLAVLSPATRQHRLAVMIDFHTSVVARRAQQIESGGSPTPPEEQFIAMVVDMTVGALSAPVGIEERSAPPPA